jgi:hypothetical protein
MKLLEGLPYRDFNCRLVYYTPAGHRRHFYGKTRAVMADIALDIAERQLKADKRRLVARVTYGEAIEQ